MSDTTPTPLCRCGHREDVHTEWPAGGGAHQCGMCGGDDERSWRHPFTPAEASDVSAAVRDELHELLTAGGLDLGQGAAWRSAEADRLLDAYRAVVLREAADAVAEFTGNRLDVNAQMLRRRADGTPREGDPR